MNSARIDRRVIAVSLLIALFLSAAPVAAEGTVRVLCYHTFAGRSTQYDIAPGEFKMHMDSIEKMGYRFVRFSDMVSGNIQGDNNILVTIDDGNVSLLEVYDSILRRKKIEPLLFIYPAIISHVDYALTWEQVLKIKSDQVPIAAHGYYHLFLNQKQYDKDKKAFLKEIYDSKSVLEKKLGTVIDTFAYSFGTTSDIAREELKKANYKYAFTINWGIVKVPLDKNADTLKLPRYLITKDSWKTVKGVLGRKG